MINVCPQLGFAPQDAYAGYDTSVYGPTEVPPDSTIYGPINQPSPTTPTTAISRLVDQLIGHVKPPAPAPVVTPVMFGGISPIVLVAGVALLAVALSSRRRR